MNILIEPHLSGSHALFIDTITKIIPSVTVLSLTGKKWHWASRVGALYFVHKVPPGDQIKTLFVTSVFNLSELVGMRPDLNITKKIIYFHENQLVYPIRKSRGERDFQYGYNQIISCLTADLIYFNSRFNMNSFISHIPSYLNVVPGIQFDSEEITKIVIAKSSVLYFPIDTAVPDLLEVVRKDVLQIVWPHRWEHDKNPELFFETLFNLKDNGCKFSVSVLGESTNDIPPIFKEAETKLNEEILHFGYLPSKEEYNRVLLNADVVVSTADHEFFGVSVIEAIIRGCYPLCPNRLVYPEYLGSSHLYSTPQQLFKKLRHACNNLASFRKATIDCNLELFYNVKEQYLKIFE